MLDRPTTRDGWLARAAALKIEGRAFIDGRLCRGAGWGETFADLANRRQRLRRMSLTATPPTSTARSPPARARSRAASGATPIR